MNTMTVNDVDWISIGKVDDIPKQGSRIVKSDRGDIAVFRTKDDELFALLDQCPHKGGPLSQGIVHGDRVSCPLHDWKIQLRDGQASAPDEGCTATFPLRVDNGNVYLCLTPNGE